MGDADAGDRLVNGSGAIDLGNCDREPIHKLGMIQNFGALIAVNADLIIVQLSRNLDAILGRETGAAAGNKLDSVFPAAAIRQLQDRMRSAGDEAVSERLFAVDLGASRQLFDIALHASGEHYLIEFEPHDADAFAAQLSTLQPVMASLDNADDVSDLCHRAAVQVKAMLGFDRVMVYRFHDDQSGEVIAEAREPHLETFQNLRYPKSDIPSQARALYVRNPFRIISDVNAPPVPIVPETSLSGEPLDLSDSVLRAVSPIHIEYLQNMGVGASLSISIIIDGKLWGLFACHHYSPRILPFPLRTVAELFSGMFSLLLDRQLHQESTVRRLRARDIHNKLMARLAGGAGLAENLDTIDSVIGDVIPHSGSSAYIEGEYRTRGKAPNEEEFLALVPKLNAATTSKVFAHNELGAIIPAALAFADRAVGALVIPVSRRPRDFFVLWRQELPQVVNWAGEPEKTIEYGPNGPRLSPRKSFEAWQESVKGRSAPWNEDEVNIAESLRVTLIEVILRLTDQAMQERASAQQQQELLIAELNHRVRNILNLIRGLITQSQGEAVDVESFSRIVGGRISALANAHDQITRENWSPASVTELILNEARAYLNDGNRDRLTVVGNDVLIAPEAFTVLALVFHEMMTNSVKYGSLCDSSGTLTVTLERGPGDDLHIAWRERGGPPVKAPTRRGFGTTIIRRSIPHELGGDAEIFYKLGGVEAHFAIPATYVSAAPKAGASGRASGDPVGSEDDNGQDGGKGDDAHGGPDRAHEDGASAGSSIPNHVLLVEDSMIIALDTEDSLRQIGVAIVNVAGSVASAMSVVEKDPPDMAILDYNLGSETSDAVADALRSRGIPFFLATGYGDMGDRMQDSGAMGVLKKPYDMDDIASALEQMATA